MRERGRETKEMAAVTDCTSLPGTPPANIPSPHPSLLFRLAGSNSVVLVLLRSADMLPKKKKETVVPGQRLHQVSLQNGVRVPGEAQEQPPAVYPRGECCH